MDKSSFSQFQQLAAGCDIVPVYVELPADMETPVSILGRFADDDNVFLLESVEHGERFGRYSFIGIRPRGIFAVNNDRAYFNGREMTFTEYPLDALKQLVTNAKVAIDPALPPLPGGAVGFLTYEAAAMFEELPRHTSGHDEPSALFMITDHIIAFDNIRHTLKIIIAVHLHEYDSLNAAFAAATRGIAEISAVIQAPKPEAEKHEYPAFSPLKPEISRQEYCRMVEKTCDYIHDGEIIQAVISQRFSTELPCRPFDLYRALRFVNPSPYTFFIKIGQRILVGSSPETMVKLQGRRSSLRPIAGTRRRGATPAADRAMADELLNDPKERAEHLMLVDLGRNDLGRTALPGSVQVRSFMNVERYSHVMHLVSDVEAELRPDADAFALLRTTFPAGTLSGAPKIRAMEIIHEVEKSARGAYGGAAGYISYDGNMDMAITIRTFQINGTRLSVQAGAGIVSDSVPENEFEETVNKGAALFQAVKTAVETFGSADESETGGSEKTF